MESNWNPGDLGERAERAPMWPKDVDVQSAVPAQDLRPGIPGGSTGGNPGYGAGDERLRGGDAVVPTGQPASDVQAVPAQSLTPRPSLRHGHTVKGLVLRSHRGVVYVPFEKRDRHGWNAVTLFDPRGVYDRQGYNIVVSMADVSCDEELLYDFETAYVGARTAAPSLESIENLHREIREKDKAWKAAKIELAALKAKLDEDFKAAALKQALGSLAVSANEHLDEAEGVLESVVEELAEGKNPSPDPALWLQVAQSEALIAIAKHLVRRS